MKDRSFKGPTFSDLTINHFHFRNFLVIVYFMLIATNEDFTAVRTITTDHLLELAGEKDVACYCSVLPPHRKMMFGFRLSKIAFLMTYPHMVLCRQSPVP